MAVQDLMVVVITTGTTEQAESISRQLVELRLAACVTTVSQVRSTYRWQGEILVESECLLLAKTNASIMPQLIAMVKKMHCYSVPEIIALPIIGGNPDYLNWIAQETTE